MRIPSRGPWTVRPSRPLGMINVQNPCAISESPFQYGSGCMEISVRTRRSLRVECCGMTVDRKSAQPHPQIDYRGSAMINLDMHVHFISSGRSRDSFCHTYMTPGRFFRSTPVHHLLWITGVVIRPCPELHQYTGITNVTTSSGSPGAQP